MRRVSHPSNQPTGIIQHESNPFRQSRFRAPSIVRRNYGFFFGVNTAPHFGHFMLSESIRRISLGGIEKPHFVQIVLSAARTASKLTFRFGVIRRNDSSRPRRIQDEDTTGDSQ